MFATEVKIFLKSERNLFNNLSGKAGFLDC